MKFSQLDTGIKVGDVMKTNLATIAQSETAAIAAAKMAELGVGSLLLTGLKGEITGILTEKDLVTKALAKKTTDVQINKLATTNLITIDANEDITKAAELMGKKNVKRLVAKSGQKIVGILTQKDLISISPSLYELIAAKQSGIKIN